MKALPFKVLGIVPVHTTFNQPTYLASNTLDEHIVKDEMVRLHLALKDGNTTIKI